MIESVSAPTWSESNQRYLVAEFARLKAILGGAPTADALAEIAEVQSVLSAPSAIDWLADALALTSFERDLLLLCAGVEMDGALASGCAVAVQAAREGRVTFGLALATLDEAHWSATTPTRPLRRWRLIEVEERPSLTTSPLRIDERVLHFLAGLNPMDERLRPRLRRREAPARFADAHRSVATAAIASIHDHGTPPPVIGLYGNDTRGQADVAALIAAELGLQLHVLRSEHLPTDVTELDVLATLWRRESVLLPSALLLRCADATPPAVASRFVEMTEGLLLVAAREPLPVQRTTVSFDVNRPGPLDQKRLWQATLGPTAAQLGDTIEALASQFSLSAGTIAATGTQIAPHLEASDTPREDLWHACRALGRPRLEELAQRIEPAATWDDLVLPETERAMLHEIGAHARGRVKVYETWGFARRSRLGLGITALFAGESGTGKTMAAEVLAHELALDLYRIDLSAVVSKYIGETEKNLRRVFDAAEDSGAILLFDEADALFGKRSEVKDSHDRYANIEVSYLLQRMEAYRGLAILTTNMRSSLDAAFQRRLRFIVNFRFPNTARRAEIWRRIFPAETPVRDLDFVKLAQLSLAGGSIHNIALNAAFMAAADGAPVDMGHLLRAARSEASKFDRPLAEAEIRGWT